MIIPVILAGGSGTRLWPMSRALYPKQLIDIYNNHTMLQNTLLRLAQVQKLGDPLVLCNESHRFMTAEQLRQIDRQGQIILEPVGKNTAPAIALAALRSAAHKEDPVLLVLPADHVIADEAQFTRIIEQGRTLAEAGNLVTFGIVPTKPATGYGYIRKGKALGDGSGGFAIDAFVEKPDRQTAQSYVDSKNFCWNSGMFMFKTSVILKELDAFAPDCLCLCRTALEKGEADLDFFRVDRGAFEAIEGDSIDYAVMEQTDRGVVIPLDAGWNDLGSFDALWQTGDKDASNNVMAGDVIVHDVTDTFIHADHRLVTATGLNGFVIVETADAVMVAPRQKVQDVKQIVTHLKKKGRQEARTHSRVYRPWGDYETIDEAGRYQVKRITVKPGAKLSLQKHFHRAEHWTVVSGTAIVTKGTQEIMLREDESVYIPLGEVHRLENPGKIPLELIEVQSGPYLGEDDIVRFDDVYNRKKEDQV